MPLPFYLVIRALGCGQNINLHYCQSALLRALPYSPQERQLTILFRGL